jgi:hypothetical protein
MTINVNIGKKQPIDVSIGKGQTIQVNLDKGIGVIKPHDELTNLEYENSGHTGFEADLGTPEADGYILSSETDGTRSWVELPESTYTGEAERTVGGITEGDEFENASMTEMWDKLIKQEKFPTLTAPSSTFTASQSGYKEVGEIINITFNSTFSRGSISPQYTAESPYRSGLPNTYVYTGTDLSNQSKTDLTDEQTINGYTIVVGAQSWTGRVSYDAGVQPKSSYGNDYSTPLSAGNTSIVTRTLTGVYPYYATTVTIGTLTKQTLTSMSSTYVQTDVVAESGSDKQTADFPDGWSAITGIQIFNELAGVWEWINGSKVNSLTTFTTTSVTHDIQGNNVSYTRYTHKGSMTGSRKLRWYTT